MTLHHPCWAGASTAPRPADDDPTAREDERDADDRDQAARDRAAEKES